MDFGSYGKYILIFGDRVSESGVCEYVFNIRVFWLFLKDYMNYECFIDVGYGYFCFICFCLIFCCILLFIW